MARKKKPAYAPETCTTCGAQVAHWDGTQTGGLEAPRFLCQRCFNTETGERAGVPYKHVDLEPVVLRDGWGKAHTFHFRVRALGGGVLYLDAFELVDSLPGGYEFQAIGHDGEDALELFQQLYQRLRRELGRSHLEKHKRWGVRHVTEEGVVRGRITADLGTEPRLPAVVIDGRELTWREFGEIVTSREGCLFKLEFYDRSEER
jgi:hypothetical protein